MEYHGRNTYKGVINNVDENLRSFRITNLDSSPEAKQTWILEAERDISKAIAIEERHPLQLLTDVDEYQFIDRPPITGINISGALLVVTTQTAHQLTADDRVHISGVFGTDEANGDFVVTTPSSTTLGLKYVFDVMDASNETPIKIQTKKQHGLITGASVVVSGVTGNTAANGTHTITVVDRFNFTLDAIAGNGTYSGGGIVTYNATSSSAYTAGGMLWRSDELPSHMRIVDRLRYESNGFVRIVEIGSMEELHIDEKTNTYVIQDRSGAVNIPKRAAIGRQDLIRYLKVWPAPIEDLTVDAFGKIYINPKFYQTHPLTTNIHLDAEYENLIALYVESKILEAAGNVEYAMAKMNAFQVALRRDKTERPIKVRMAIKYR